MAAPEGRRRKNPGGMKAHSQGREPLEPSIVIKETPER